MTKSAGRLTTGRGRDVRGRRAIADSELGVERPGVELTFTCSLGDRPRVVRAVAEGCDEGEAARIELALQNGMDDYRRTSRLRAGAVEGHVACWVRPDDLPQAVRRCLPRFIAALAAEANRTLMRRFNVFPDIVWVGTFRPPLDRRFRLRQAVPGVHGDSDVGTRAGQGGQERFLPPMTPGQEPASMNRPIVERSRLSAQQYSEVRDHFTSFDATLEQSLKPHLEAFQEYLYSLEGLAFEDRARNQQLAEFIHRTAVRLGVRVACPRCGAPSFLRHSPFAGRTKHGSFGFIHRVGAHRTNHAGAVTLPRLPLVPAPPDGRSRKKGRTRA